MVRLLKNPVFSSIFIHIDGFHVKKMQFDVKYFICGHKNFVTNFHEIFTQNGADKL